MRNLAAGALVYIRYMVVKCYAPISLSGICGKIGPLFHDYSGSKIRNHTTHFFIDIYNQNLNVSLRPSHCWSLALRFSGVPSSKVYPSAEQLPL